MSYQIPVVGGPYHGRFVQTDLPTYEFPVSEYDVIGVPDPKANWKARPGDSSPGSMDMSYVRLRYEIHRVSIPWTSGKFECKALVYDKLARDERDVAVLSMFFAASMSVGARTLGGGA